MICSRTAASLRRHQRKPFIPVMSHSNRENVRVRQRMLFVVKYLVVFIVAVFSGFIVVLLEGTINVYIATQRLFKGYFKKSPICFIWYRFVRKRSCFDFIFDVQGYANSLFICDICITSYFICKICPHTIHFKHLFGIISHNKFSINLRWDGIYNQIFIFITIGNKTVAESITPTYNVNFMLIKNISSLFSNF